jgi:hypothetical protein
LTCVKIDFSGLKKRAFIGNEEVRFVVEYSIDLMMVWKITTGKNCGINEIIVCYTG